MLCSPTNLKVPVMATQDYKQMTLSLSCKLQSKQKCCNNSEEKLFVLMQHKVLMLTSSN